MQFFKPGFLLESARKVYDENRRLVVPLMGFPGLNLTDCTVKLAQQNFEEHFKVINALTEKFKPDAIFPLMDLSVEANALGRYTVFPKEESAVVVHDDFTESDLNKIEKINIAYDTRLNGYVETLKLMNKNLPSSVLRGAYITGPYTLAALLIGADNAAIATVMKTDDLHKLCSVVTKKIMDYAELLIAAGAQMICVLEPSAVMLGPEQFKEFSSNYVQQIVSHCKYSEVAVIYHVCGNTTHLIEKMCESGVDALSLDSSEAGVDLPALTKLIPKDVIVIGNICPTGSILNGNPNDVKEEVLNLLKDMDSFPNFILSTGCDLPQKVPVHNIQAFMETGRNYKIT